MEHKQFLEKLSELAEWEVRKTGPNGCAKKPRKKKGEPVIEPTEEELDETVLEEDAAAIQALEQRNMSLAPVIVKIKHTPKMCEDCQNITVDRQTTRRLVDYPVIHWREKCNCGLHKNPITGKFDLESNQQLYDVFRKYLIGKE
jgi:hypothetical protein